MNVGSPPVPEAEVPHVAEFDRAISGGIIGTRIFSGAAASAAKTGALFHQNHYGNTSFDPPNKKVTEHTCWDLGALTKPLGTGLAIMWLIGKGRLAIDAPVSRLLSDFQGPVWDKILVEHLLDHSSGLPTRIPIWETLKAEQEKNPAVVVVGTRLGEKRAREMTAKMVPNKGPGEVSLYSEIGFMILGFIVESITGKRLDAFLQNDIYKPLGLTNLFFVDLCDPKAPFGKRPFMASTFCKWRKRVIVGQVDDSDAYAMGGVAGHAGLFGPMGDVFKLAQMLLDSYLGKAEGPFHTGTAKRFLKRSNRASNTTWALAWDTPAPRDAMAGARMSRNAVGHLSLIGHALWIDLQNEVVTLTLTNRVHPQLEGKEAFMAKFRPHLEDLYAGYAKSWTPPPPGEEEIDEYAIVREREAKKKKMMQAGKPGQKPQAPAPTAGMKKAPQPPPK